jgi:hypothetical protein
VVATAIELMEALGGNWYYIDSGWVDEIRRDHEIRLIEVETRL